MTLKFKFPEGFKWGSAVWAQGTEGAFDKDGKAPTVFDEYYRREPNRFFNGIGPSETLNWYEDYQKYADLANDISHNSFRTSILWARLIPDGKHVNQKAVIFYRNLFKSFKDHGMELSIVLYWFDMPLLYEDKGGFSNREIINDFVFYCKTCFELFDDLVDIWYVYNEPIVDVYIKYLENRCYPNDFDLNKANISIYHMVVAHALVVQAYKKGDFHSKIGTVLNHSYVYPRSQHPEDLKAADIYRLFMQKSFASPFLKGYVEKEWLDFLDSIDIKIPVLDGDLELIKENTIDVLGLNIYMPERVKAKEVCINPKAPLTFDSFFDTYQMPGSEMNSDRGWEIYPQVIYDALIEIKNDYGNPEMYITENGMGVQDEGKSRNKEGMIEDDYRIDYVRRHLEYAHKAIEDGANLKGYNMWSFIDLWSPSNQFKNCYGFYEFDLETKETRLKKSALWFKKITEDNGF